MTVGHADGEQHERARRAAERAARLVEELTRARIDVELFERQRRRSPLPGPAGAAAGTRGPRRRPALLTLGLWLITLYLLVTMLAQEPPNATDSTVYQPRAVLELTTAPAPADGALA
ncbi:hypothetical protein [uncultured Arthrobacter sp.]|uniref:hypothetical protein n=1 Tax=uncultured Arthrobacter sp. TaxID=114050 RepID=UPI0026175DFD|nr:hypothetical protein [uncultured Arthrobacter sp.]